MKPAFFHECEVKYQLRTPAERAAAERQVQKQGFVYEGRQLETDFLPDAEDFLCRQHGILLRFRRIITKSGSSDILLTLKVKGKATSFQENYELEYRFSAVNEETFKSINRLLKGAAAKELPASIHEYDAQHFDELVQKVKIVFPAHRILLEKKRTTYTKKDCHVLLDTLPEGIGDYLEIEAPSPEKLAAVVAEFGLDASRAESLDYGDILKRHKQGQPDHAARTGLFAAEERDL